MTLAPPLRPDHDPAVLAAAAAALGPRSLTFRVGDGSVTYESDGSTITSREGGAVGDTVVALDAHAWDDFIAQMRTFVNLFLTNGVTIETGSFDQVADWDPALKYLHAGIPPYDPARADLRGRDPRAVMSLNDSDDELRAQLTTMGYLLVRGVFTADEMARANEEVDRLAALARKGDDQSWWAVDASGADVLCRLVYASLRSEHLASLEHDPRVVRLGTLLSPDLALYPDRMEGASVLLKVGGETQGLSNIPWHQDCGMGGHAVYCPSALVGMWLTGSSAETGNLKVVPGSHGQSLHYGWANRKDVPVVDIDTEPGDVTVHIADVMHASPKPTGAGGRRTMYVDFYPPKIAEHVGPGQAFNDIVRNRTQEVGALA